MRILFLLGHVAYGYVLVKTSSRILKIEIPMAVALFVGITPDFDFFFGWAGVEHHAITHSLFFWILPATILVLLIKKKAIPPLIGIMQHFAGDLMTSVPLFLPVSGIGFGFALGMPSTVDSAVEILGLTIMMVYMWKSGDLERTVCGGEERRILILTCLSILAISISGALSPNLSHLIPIIETITLSPEYWNMMIILAGHAILLAVMVLPMLAYIMKKGLRGTKVSLRSTSGNLRRKPPNYLQPFKGYTMREAADGLPKACAERLSNQ